MRAAIINVYHEVYGEERRRRKAQRERVRLAGAWMIGYEMLPSPRCVYVFGI